MVSVKRKGVPFGAKMYQKRVSPLVRWYKKGVYYYEMFELWKE